MHKFKFVIESINGTVFNDLVDKIVISTDNGEITVLKNHIPIITTITKGRLIIDNNIKYEISDGVLKVNKEETLLMINTILKK